MTSALTFPDRTRSDFARILTAGLLTGVSDISFANATYLFRRGILDPGRVFQSVASGVAGPESYNSGMPTIVLGAFLHFTIALIWTTIFVLATRRSTALTSIVSRTGGALVFGYVYGMFIWLAMNFIVIPLSHAKVTPLSAPVFWIMLFGHGIFVGIPIVMLARDRSPVWSRLRVDARPIV
ncbi:MAG: hypothetical protein ABIT38_09680 [Gemmatimonadaceae bacterium]